MHYYIEISGTFGVIGEGNDDKNIWWKHLISIYLYNLWSSYSFSFSIVWPPGLGEEPWVAAAVAAAMTASGTALLKRNVPKMCPMTPNWTLPSSQLAAKWGQHYLWVPPEEQTGLSFLIVVLWLLRFSGTELRDDKNYFWIPICPREVIIKEAFLGASMEA